MPAMEDIQLIYSNPYEQVKALCHRVKEPNGVFDIPRQLLAQAWSALGRQSILIPVPGHLGTPDDMTVLCGRIRDCGRAKRINIIEMLRGDARPSLCEAKRRGDKLPDVTFTINGEETSAEDIALLSKTFDIVLVDNVLDSGRTAQAAQRALGVPCKLITLGSTGRSGVPLPKLWYDIVRVSNQDNDRADYERVKTLVEHDDNCPAAIRYLSDWDYGTENIGAALASIDGVRATPTDPRATGDRVIHADGGYALCQASSNLYNAYYLVREFPRGDFQSYSGKS